MKIDAGGWSIQAKLSTGIILVSLFLIATSSLWLYDAFLNQRHADRMVEILNCTEPLFKSIESLAFERGRTNVVLAAESPITEQNREFILGRRRLTDSNLLLGLERLRRIDAALADRLQNEYQQFQLLQMQNDEQANLPLTRRNPMIRNKWLRQSSEFIVLIRDAIELLGRSESPLGKFDVYHHLQLNCVEFRLFSGYSASILTAAVNTGKELNPSDYQAFLESNAKADYTWEKIQNDSAGFNNAVLRDSTQRLYFEYYQVYRPLQNEILSQLLSGTVSKDWGDRLAYKSIPAFDSVFKLIDAIETETRHHVDWLKSRAELKFRIALSQFLLISIFLAFFLFFFRIMFFAPLKRIVKGMQNILHGQQMSGLDADVQRRDEIGLLARGTLTLQTSIMEERRLRELNERLATTDRLTGLFNREMLDQQLGRIMAQSDRYNQPLSMILFDLDHFKHVNDTWGHPVGDEVLIHIAQTVKNIIRGADLLIRFGGEEFLILMPNTMEAEAASATEKIRVRLVETCHPAAEAVTASFGVVERAVGEEFVNWYKRADDALYRAKKAGRNCIVCYGHVLAPAAPLHLKWVSEWDSGHPEIDAQHRRLFEMANEYFALVFNPQANPNDVGTLLTKILRELSHHFEVEEQILLQISYPKVSEHRQIHCQLLTKAETLYESYRNGKIKLSNFVSFLVDDVVVGHMIQEDQLYYPLTRPRRNEDTLMTDERNSDNK